MATLIDRFICRREGHKPAVTITSVTGVTFESWITTCVRCGKAFEVVPASSPAPPPP